MSEANRNFVRYENRLVTFIDICGFKQLVEKKDESFQHESDLYCLLKQVTSDSLTSETYGSIPTLGLDGTFDLKMAGDLDEEARKSAFRIIERGWPISITHFSDCFVISTPADNFASCAKHFELVRVLVRVFLRQKVIVRGGMTLGELIHESSGVLFGPAMNRAYLLESGRDFAVWPRILIDESAHDLFCRVFLPQHPLQPLCQKAEGDFWQITPASCIFGDKSMETRSDVQRILESLRNQYIDDPKLGPRYADLLENWRATLGAR